MTTQEIMKFLFLFLLNVIGYISSNICSYSLASDYPAVPDKPVQDVEYFINRWFTVDFLSVPRQFLNPGFQTGSQTKLTFR